MVSPLASCCIVRWNARIESGSSHEIQHLPYGIPISCRHGSHPGDSGRSRRPRALSGWHLLSRGHPSRLWNELRVGSIKHTTHDEEQLLTH